ncbi:MAG TPA: SpoIID/LytB domain-containing protein [Solirubrobacterales bacterium]
MRTRLALFLAASLLVAPAPAGAGVAWVVRGHGFGHGVGMSAYGAYGYATHGFGYRAILGHYYTGTTMGTIDGPRVVRVLVGIDPGDIEFSGATSACGRPLDPGATYAAHLAGGGVRLRTGGGRALADCGGKLRAAGPGSVRVDGDPYRGALEVVPTRSDPGSLNAINAVAVDQYVKGVIPNESPPSWPMAELEAQAVASRSIALSTSVGGNGFDLYDDTRSQVYRGIASETPRTNAAAAETRGQVVLYDDEIAETFFSACSGGHTESVQNVFFGPPIPYLVGVPDPYDGACPLHSWTLRFSGAEISARLGGYLDGRLKQIVVTKRGVSPRIVWARLIGTGGTTMIRGDQLQSALGAYDRWMTFTKVVDGRAAPAPQGGGGAAGGVSQPSG